MENNMNERPKCGCGHTKDPDGYCDGSHANIVKENKETEKDEELRTKYPANVEGTLEFNEANTVERLLK